MLDEMEVFYKKASKADSKTDPKKLGKLLGESVDRFNAIFELSGTLGPFIYSLRHHRLAQQRRHARPLGI